MDAKINKNELDILDSETNTDPETNTDSKDIENNLDNENDLDESILYVYYKYNFSFFIFSLIILGILFICLLVFTINSKFDNMFILNQFCRYLVICITQYLSALLVIYKNVKVNYTRKIIHISYFIWPQIFDLLFGYEKSVYTELWNVWIILILLLMMHKIIRDRVSIINTMFKAVDRPEDRPHTLFWFSSQIIVGLMVIIPFSIYFNYIDKIGLIFIPILINGLADGLAEPVGIRFGKHKYQTKALLSSKKYTRSYEGSFCVFIVSTIIIACYYKYINLDQYLFSLFVIPIMSTLAEAFAPHTWDSPFIYLVVSLLLVLVTQLL